MYPDHERARIASAAQTQQWLTDGWPDHDQTRAEAMSAAEKVGPVAIQMAEACHSMWRRLGGDCVTIVAPVCMPAHYWMLSATLQTNSLTGVLVRREDHTCVQTSFVGALLRGRPSRRRIGWLLAYTRVVLDERVERVFYAFVSGAQRYHRQRGTLPPYELNYDSDLP